jgi:ElaB/YqjD/DUF883 family membrane-anchored ribosome-binding protein
MMKTNTQNVSASAVKADVAKGLKSLKRKTTTGAKRARKSLNSSSKSAKSSWTDYSDSANRFMNRGKSVLGNATDWAGKNIPRATSHLPDQRTVQSFMSEKPLIIGAVGLGIGVMIGSMLPSIHSKPTPPRRKTGQR